MLASLLPPTNLSPWTMLRAVWEPHLWVFLASLLLALVLTPVFRLIAMRLRIYDMPDERLKTHKRPIPYLGGLAIFLGWAVPVLIVAAILTANPSANVLPEATARAVEGVIVRPPPVLETSEGQVPGETTDEGGDLRVAASPVRPVEPRDRAGQPWIEHPEKLFWIVGAALLMLLLGLYDDLKDLSPKLKIIGQVAAALILVAGGMVFKGFPRAMPKDLGGFGLFPPEVWWVIGIGAVLQVILVVGAANATNLLDGLDGLCSGVTAFISVGFLVLATSLLAWELFNPDVFTAVHYSQASIIVLLALALLGSVLGFLPYNFYPASIFMGDAGSMFLGFMAAVFMILFAERSEGFKWFLASMVIFGLPIFDTGLALVRRLVNRQPIFAGDRSHFYDQLVDRGFTAKRSVIINYCLAAFLTVAGVGIVFLKMRYALLIYVAIFIAIAVVALKLGFVRGRAGPRTGGPGRGSGGAAP